MIDPYAALGVRRDADEATIRRKYLQLVRRHSPERDPERFAEIRAAYDQLRDPIVRLKNRLFNTEVSHTLDDLVAETRPNVREHRIATEILLSLAQP